MFTVLHRFGFVPPLRAIFKILILSTILPCLDILGPQPKGSRFLHERRKDKTQASTP